MPGRRSSSTYGRQGGWDGALWCVPRKSSLTTNIRFASPSLPFPTQRVGSLQFREGQTGELQFPSLMPEVLATVVAFLEAAHAASDGGACLVYAQ